MIFRNPIACVDSKAAVDIVCYATLLEREEWQACNVSQQAADQQAYDARHFCANVIGWKLARRVDHVIADV